MIKNIIFDIGNVLVDFCWPSLMDELGLSDLKEEFGKTVFGSHWWKELDRGVEDEDEMYENMRRDNEKHLAEFDLVWENKARLASPYDYAVPFIEELKCKGYKVYLLSNYPRSMFALHAENGAFPFLDKVDGRVVSGDVRLVKPNREIYECLLDKYGLEPSECLFFDDREDNVLGARAAGINGVVFEGYEKARELIEDL